MTNHNISHRWSLFSCLLTLWHCVSFCFYSHSMNTALQSVIVMSTINPYDVIFLCSEMHRMNARPFEWRKFHPKRYTEQSKVNFNHHRRHADVFNLCRIKWNSLAALDANIHFRLNSEYSNSVYFTFCINFHFHRVKFTMSLLLVVTSATFNLCRFVYMCALCMLARTRRIILHFHVTGFRCKPFDWRQTNRLSQWFH